MTNIADLPNGATKSETLKVKVEGKDYLNFTNLASRLVFPEKMNDRQEKEAVLNLSITVLGAAVNKLVNAGNEFIPANPEKILQEVMKPEGENFEEKYAALKKIIYMAKPADVDGGILVDAKSWLKLREAVGLEGNGTEVQE